MKAWQRMQEAQRKWEDWLTFEDRFPATEPPQLTLEQLAQSYLERADEDRTWCDPEDVKRLARAVLDRDA